MAKEMSVIKTDPFKFAVIASKPQSQMAAELADEIKISVYKHCEKMPLALAIGVLRIVERDLLDDIKDY